MKRVRPDITAAMTPIQDIRADNLPGVTIGLGAVAGAGAAVTKDVPPNTLVTGPAAFARKAWNE